MRPRDRSSARGGWTALPTRAPAFAARLPMLTRAAATAPVQAQVSIVRCGVHLERLRDDPLGAELLFRSQASPASHLLPQLWILDQRHQGIRERRRIPWRYQESVVAIAN